MPRGGGGGGRGLVSRAIVDETSNGAPAVRSVWHQLEPVYSAVMDVIHRITHSFIVQSGIDCTKGSVTRVHAVLAVVLRLHCIIISMLGKTLRPDSKIFLSVLSCCIQLQVDIFSAL